MKIRLESGRGSPWTRGQISVPALSSASLATGANMRLEVYRVAYDEASAELTEILAKFEQLRLRKERVEKVVDALKPLVVSNEFHTRTQAPSTAPERTSVSAERPAVVAEVPIPSSVSASGQVAHTLASEPVPSRQAVDEAADPFSRRVENVTGMSSAARDVREYSRLFNSSPSR